jgi:hypothetical protein
MNRLTRRKIKEDSNLSAFSFCFSCAPETTDFKPVFGRRSIFCPGEYVVVSYLNCGAGQEKIRSRAEFGHAKAFKKRGVCICCC